MPNKPKAKKVSQAQVKAAMKTDAKRRKTLLDEGPTPAMKRKMKTAEMDAKMQKAAKRNYKNQ